MRIEANKPMQLPVDSVFRFGESTRKYVLRERPRTGHRPIMDELEKTGSEADGGLLGLPETENELDNLTEFNTAQNRRISMLGIAKDPENFVKKKRRIMITFNDEEDVINPEDIDPSVGETKTHNPQSLSLMRSYNLSDYFAGKFRNMIQSSIIPKATSRHQNSGFGLGRHTGDSDSLKGHGGRGEGHHRAVEELYDEEDPAMFSTTLSSSLGLSLPNPAPSVELDTSDDGESDNMGKQLHLESWRSQIIVTLVFELSFNVV